MRPADLAKRLGVSKQALNHLLGQLEKLRYLQRRREQGNGHIAIYFTKRGWLVLESTIATMRQLESDWQCMLGQRWVSTKKVESSRQTGHQKAVKEGFSVKLAMPGVMNLAVAVRKRRDSHLRLLGGITRHRSLRFS